VLYDVYASQDFSSPICLTVLTHLLRLLSKDSLRSLLLLFAPSLTGVKKQKTIPSSISVAIPASVLKEEATVPGKNMTPGKKKKSDDGNSADRKRKHKAEK
jgi:hypothetical protein